jgi:hypothetical protein
MNQPAQELHLAVDSRFAAIRKRVLRPLSGQAVVSPVSAAYSARRNRADSHRPVRYLQRPNRLSSEAAAGVVVRSGTTVTRRVLTQALPVVGGRSRSLPVRASAKCLL